MDELDIWRSAHLLIKQHGEDAAAVIRGARRRGSKSLLRYSRAALQRARNGELSH